MSQLMNLLKLLKRLADRSFFTVASFLCRLVKTPRTKTLLIVRTDGIGDFVYFTRYLRTIREFYASYRIVLVCRTETAPIAANVQLVDNVIGFKHLRYRHNYAYRLRILRRIRSFSPEVALYASYHRQHIGDEMTLLSGASTTVAFSGNDESIHASMRLRNNSEYSRVIEVPDHVPERDKYEILLSSLGCSPDEFSDDTAFAHVLAMPDLQDAERLSKIIAQGYFFIAPGGSGAIRRWPADKFSALADRLASEFHLQIVLCGNRDEEDILHETARTMKSRAEICASLDLLQVIVLMKRASAFVGNESGLLHLAASLNIPAVGILGGGHFSRYFPYGSALVVNNKLDCYECDWNCKFPEPYCITDIAVDRVMDVCRRLQVKNG